jgi:hypothetical protein
MTTEIDDENILKAMQEAREDEAVRFAEWIAKKGIKESASEGMWLILEEGSFEDIKERISTTNLYNLFKQE